MTIRKLALPFAIAAALATGGVALAQPKSGENDAVTDLAKARISLVQAIGTAERHAGGRATGAELGSEDGVTAFEVEVVAANRSVHEVKVDATSGKILSMKADGPDNGKDSDGEDKAD